MPAPDQTLPLSRAALHQQVVEHLRTSIVRGTLEPGETLRVSELAQKLDVSLTPLREALKILAEEQLVELTPNRPVRVAPVTGPDTMALFEVMAGLEGLAAELAADRMSAADFAHLEARHAEMRQHYESGERDAYFALNREIHNLIVEFARNPALTHVRAKLAYRSERVRFMAVRQGSRRSEAFAEHEELMQCLRDRDAKASHRVWSGHLLKSGAETCRILELRGGAQTPTDQIGKDLPDD